MTHLDALQHIVQTEPWEIAHRLWDCMDCPKLPLCNQLMLQRRKGAIDITERDICKKCMDEWLHEQIAD